MKVSRSRRRNAADLVVVANRLPVDRVVGDDGEVTWRPSPGGLVSALEPIMRRNNGAWIGWPGDASKRPRPDRGAVRPPRADPRPGGPLGAGGRGVLRGLLERHPVAALPRPRRQAGVPPRVVGLLRHGQPALRRRRREARRRGCQRLGAGLPAPAGPGDAARAASRPAHRLLPAHPVPARRAVQPAAVAPPDPRGTARRRPGRLPAQRRGRQLRAAGAPARGAQDPPRHRLPAPTAGRSTPGRSRSPSTSRSSRSSPAPRRSRSAPTRSATTSATPPRCSSASTGSTTPRASTPGCAPSAS